MNELLRNTRKTAPSAEDPDREFPGCLPPRNAAFALLRKTGASPFALSRREIARLILGPVLGWKLLGRKALAEPAPLLQVDRLEKENPAPAMPHARRQYRADAVILLFGVTVYRRTYVGGGYVMAEESAGAGVKRTALQFGAGSQPERARGLNRLGFMKEVVLEREAAAEGAYFGFMASSPEESLEQAKRSLGKPDKDKMPYTAIDGANGAGRTRSAVSYFQMPSNYGWSQLKALIETAKSSCHAGNPAWRETKWETPGGLTFLYTLTKAIRQPGENAEAQYVYNEKKYTLQIQKGMDEKQGQVFVQRGMLKDAKRALRVKGKITNQANGSQTLFSLWTEDTGRLELPLRIEFQPRSFLRLAFEYDPAMEDSKVMA